MNLNYFRLELTFLYPFQAHDGGQLPNQLPKKNFIKGFARGDRNWWSHVTLVFRGVSEIFGKLILEWRKIHWFLRLGSGSGKGLSKVVAGSADAEETSSFYPLVTGSWALPVVGKQRERWDTMWNRSVHTLLPNSPFTFPTFWVYHCFAFLLRENENNFHRKLSSDMPAMVRHAQSCSNSRTWLYGLLYSKPKRLGPEPWL